MALLKLHRETAAIFTARDRVYGPDEEMYETDTGYSKRGNGIDSYSELDYHVGEDEGGEATTPLTSVATAAGTTTLTVSSDRKQQFTGATTQTVVLPVVSTLPYEGFHFEIINDSSGSLTVNSSGSDLVQTMIASSRALFTAIALVGTDETVWAVTYLPNVAGAIVTERSTSRSLTNVTIDSTTNTVRANSIKQNADNNLPGTCAKGDILQLLNGRIYLAFATNVWTELLAANSRALVNAQVGTTYEFTDDDNGAIVTFNNGSNITATLPDGLGAGFSCVCEQLGAGEVTVVGDGATVNNGDGFDTSALNVPFTIYSPATDIFTTTGLRA
jgi:hypothetical protein